MKDKIYKSLPKKSYTSIDKNSEVSVPNSSITFHSDITWVMEIVNDKGIRKINFNTKEFPDLTPDDFAKKVIKILHGSNLLDDLINQEAEARLNIKEK